ncbi:MAG: copper chaperone PCu(A)C [Gammaproteobacteria bacterium]|uniref:copper chaperone PCu(A)C n=1 Tax=Rhodoferax sp. TaxID=50421 RepID=UPI00181F8728|nr:copper chaperone PCu(A)C [Rhodoferax sp.]MBU3900241.1 copper chaperone PCu(A)C [Gammaproteobacteria bacterium]MBA3057926.1 copper chaperone PCu(A)C [Rhodoferax sp.]MBU3997973.1 copper chaperone PCu(A)C [Gammaproteobacteria bacterium]MBU4079421.1 copper chaperone PCu(A)C [Gammaproteobacteria bacterium]MBU4115034.1 copper chaperone PCu(A)C [Gammaproteobacteria bacterium]
MKFKTLMSSAAFAATAFACAAHAGAVQIDNAWVRATVKGQLATGAFMTITAKEGARLVGVSSPVAGVSQVHEMTMDAGVMKMGEVKGGLDLPAGKPVALKSGGYHLMLMDLKSTLLTGTNVPLSLVFKDAKGVESKVELTVPVAAVAPAGMAHGQAAPMDHSMHGNMPAKKAP